MRDSVAFLLPILAIVGGVFQISTSSHAALVQADALWTKHHLRVCFAESKEDLKNTAIDLNRLDDGSTETLKSLKIVPVRADLKPLIQQVVQDSFTEENTGIIFSGWSSCQAGNAEVVVFYVDDVINPDENSERYLAAGTIGKPEGQKRNSIRINDTKVRGYYDQSIMSNLTDLIQWSYGVDRAYEENWNQFGKYALMKDVVHEFGHIAGLLHEQERFDLKHLKEDDISQGQDYSDEINESDVRDAKLEALLPATKKKSYGELNANSTMHYFHNDYDEASERTRLICALLEKNDLVEWADLYLKGLYQKLTGTDGADFTHVALKNRFCEDTGYLLMNPKLQFERHQLLDHQSQSALKASYLHKPFEDLNADELKALDYVREHWVPLSQSYW